MSKAPFLALITPLGDGGGGGPDHIWGGGNVPMPTPPIVIPPDAIKPGVPSHPIYIPVYPAHPIVIPPGSIAPGVPTHPIVLPPPVPSHPIVIPPDNPGWGDAKPEHPIVLPPGIWGPPTMPPGFWGGGMGPGVPPQPGGGTGIWGPGQMPPGFWGGGMGPGVPSQPGPSHPIVIPDPTPPQLPPAGSVPVGSILVVVSTPDGPKWAYYPPQVGGGPSAPGYNPPPGAAVPTPHSGTPAPKK